MKNADMPATALTSDQFLSAERSGLTKREWFAGMALQGILAARTSDPIEELDALFMAGDAADAADALIEVLEESKQ